MLGRIDKPLKSPLKGPRRRGNTAVMQAGCKPAADARELTLLGYMNPWRPGVGWRRVRRRKQIVGGGDGRGRPAILHRGVRVRGVLASLGEARHRAIERVGAHP